MMKETKVRIVKHESEQATLLARPCCRPLARTLPQVAEITGLLEGHVSSA
jgi:hypothetical protein